MKSLQDITFTSLAKSLPEVLDLCTKLPHVCDVDLLKNSLIRLFGNVMIFKRGDLVSYEDWLSFSRNLLTGIQYNYGINLQRIDLDPEDPILKPIGIIGSQGTFSATIDSILPRHGSEGYFLHLYISGGYEIDHEIDINEIFWHNGHRGEYINVILTYVSELVFKTYRPEDPLNTIESFRDYLLTSIVHESDEYAINYVIEFDDERDDRMVILVDVYIYDVSI